MASVVPVSPDMLEPVVDFLSSFEDEPLPRDYWWHRAKFWWDENPAAAGLPRGWALEQQGRLVGFLGVIPTLFRLNRQTVPIGTLTTWRVDSEHRHHSLALLGAALSAREFAAILVTTPNDRTRQIYHGLRFVPFPEQYFSRRIVVPLRSVRLASAVARRTRVPPPLGLAAGILLGPVVSALRLAGMTALKNSDCEARVLSTADARFDDLWEETKDDFPGAAIRSAETLNWYCFTNDYIPKTLIGAFRGDSLVGYTIVAEIGEPESSARDIADLWIRKDDEMAARSLVRAALAVAKNEGAIALTVTPFRPELHAPLARFRPFSRPLRTGILSYRPSTEYREILAQTLFDRTVVIGT